MSGPAVARELDLPRTTVGAINRECLHVAIDDASRLVYAEVLADEKQETACAFRVRAITWFERHGVTVARPMSGNGSA